MKASKPHWSQTSARLMNACPRAWAITYATLSGHLNSSKAPPSTPPRTFDDLLTRNMRATWLKRLADQYQRKIWSIPYGKQTLENAVDDAMCLVNMGVPHLHLEMGKVRSNKQLRSLEQCQTLRPLFTGQPRRWAYFDRRTSANIGCLLYTSPSPRDKRQSRMPSSA